MNKVLKMSLFFILAYVLAEGAFYFLSKDNFFTSPMYILLPIVAYFGLFFVTPMIEEYAKWDKWTILGLFLIISIICFSLIVYIYTYEIYTVLNNTALPKDMGIWKQLISSSFLGFIIAGAIGIIASKK